MSDRFSRALLGVREARLHRKEGHARWSTCLRAFVGMTPRWCQYEMKRARQLRDYPELSAAWERGEIGISQLRVILKVVSAETENLWCARGRTLTVRQLEKLAGEERQRAAGRTDPRPAPQEPAVSPEADDKQRRHRRCVMAPPGVTVLFASAVEVARKIEGYQIGAGHAVGMMAVELMAGLPEWPEPPQREDEDPSEERAAAPSGSFLGDHGALDRLEGPGWEDFHRHMEEITRQRSDPAWDPAPVLLKGAPPDNLNVKMGDRIYRKDRRLNPDFGEEALDEDPWEVRAALLGSERLVTVPAGIP